MNHIDQLISPQCLKNALIDETSESGPSTSISTVSPDMFDAFNAQLQTSDVKTKLTLQIKHLNRLLQFESSCKFARCTAYESMNSILELSPVTSPECISVGQIHIAAPFHPQKNKPVLSTRTELLSQNTNETNNVKNRYNTPYSQLEGFEADTTTRSNYSLI